MTLLRRWLPATRSLSLLMAAVFASAAWVALGLRILARSIDNGYGPVGGGLALGAAVVAVGVWRLRYWAAQLTTAVLLCMLLFSVFGFFPVFGFEGHDGPNLATQLLRFIAFAIAPIAFAVVIARHRRDLLP